MGDAAHIREVAALAHREGISRGEAIRETVLKNLATMGFWDHSRNAAAYDRVDEAECVAKSQELAARDGIPLHEALAATRQQHIVALLTEEDAQSLGGAEAWATSRHYSPLV